MKLQKIKAFTLVELIVVITILAILATIAFMAFQNYSKDARDSVRLSDMNNIQKWLELYKIKSGTIPQAEEAKQVLKDAGSVLTYQWVLWDTTAVMIWFWKAPTDPLTKEKYIYVTDLANNGYKILIYLEWTNTTAFIPETYARDYSKSTIKVWGNWPGILMNNDGTNTIPQTDLVLSGSTTSYKILVDQTTSITWTWDTIRWTFENLALNGYKWFWAPSSCPTWFIAVPGNKEFGQPWFCVTKYEMKQTSWSDTYCTSWTPCWDWDWIIEQTDFPLANTISSQASGTSIRYIKQEAAIQACKNMWAWYHLITNNEWMTIARNIEQVDSNWSSWTTWTWFLYNWNVAWADFWTWAWDDTIELAKTGWAINTDNRRALKLSNWQVIWDLAWNVWEHVNKANTIDWTNFSKTNNKAFVLESWSNADYIELNTYIWNYFIDYVLPNNKSLTKSNWVWSLRFYDGTIFLRGGNASSWGNVGIFALILLWLEDSQTSSVGFRCSL